MNSTPILVFYVNVSNVPPSQMEYFIESYKNGLKYIPEDEYISILFPNFERHEVVCLNPNIVSEETYNDLLKNIEQFQKNYNLIKTHITNESERKEF
jgi:hypothetical protein